MRRIRLIYNPLSGDRDFARHLDAVAAAFQAAGYETSLFRLGTEPNGERLNLAELFAEPSDFDAVAVAGGDGTVNGVVNAMLANNRGCPLGIIPSGTANDFAAFLGLPQDPVEAAEVIARGRVVSIDVGKVTSAGSADKAGKSENRFFINVFEAGTLAHVSQSVDDGAKSAFGKLAYYMKGVEQLTNLSPLSFRVTNSRESFVEDLYVFIALNSSGAGGFADLSPEASVNDGLLDFVAVKAIPLVGLAGLFLKILRRDYLDDPNIIYFQDSRVKIEPLFEDTSFYATDVDGETGLVLPVEIANVHNALKIFIP